jgi:G patch domain-containing protein 1
MSQKDRERLQNIAASVRSAATSISTSATEQPPPDAPTPAATIRIPRTEPQIARAALGGFQPFPSNPVKQARYRAYLQSQANIDSEITLAPLPHQSIPEFNAEMEEYSQSAIVFKPMSGAMAGRFTSAAVVEHGPKAVEGLHTPSFTESNNSGAEQKEKEKEPELSQKEHAARIGMYGSLTRDIKAWQPAKLLCKRFGVKDPNPEPKTEPEPSSSYPQDPASSEFDSSAATPSIADIGIILSSNVGGAGSDGPRDLANVGLGDDDETQGRDTLTYERPSVDVFKAIFASDDEDSSEDEDPAEEAKDENEATSSVSAPVIVTSAAAPSLAPAPPDDQPIDTNTFKPTFVRREARMAATIDKEKKEKKEKKKRKVTVSFVAAILASRRTNVGLKVLVSIG